MSIKYLVSKFLLAVLLAGSTVVADEVGLRATGNGASADARRASSIQRPASATDATSATTSSIPHDSLAATNALPPLPPGVTELKFSECFRQPIGPRGLELSEKLRSLDGGRIRILGYMVRQDQPVAHCFLLSPLPLTLHEEEYGLCDDLPATALHVFTTPGAPAQTPFTPGLLLLTGRLTLGNRVEADGRTSSVRLQLDPPTPEQQKAAQAAAGTSGAPLLRASHVH
jgi:hypothetical protein